MMPSSTERLNLSITTSSGDLQAQIDVPTGFIPITKIVNHLMSKGLRGMLPTNDSRLTAGSLCTCGSHYRAARRPPEPNQTELGHDQSAITGGGASQNSPGFGRFPTPTFGRRT
jgi:hypothetical protein